MSPMYLSRSIVGEAEAGAVARVLLGRGYLGMGAEVQAFEAELAAYLGVRPEDVTCVNTGTAALHLAVEAAVPPGAEVLVQSLTYVASFQAIVMAGCVPVACEACPETCTLDLEDARRRLTPRTKAIMPVHYAGNPGDLEAAYAFAAEHGLRVIEDAAHAFGGTYQGRKIGAHGDIVCFSFDGIKNITCGEGGALIARDQAVSALARDARLLSVERDTEKRYAGSRSWDFDVSRIGYRYHMSNIMAAIGRTQLARLDAEFAPKRQRLAALYRKRLAQAPDVALLRMDLREVVPHISPIRVLHGKKPAVLQHLEKKGIPAGFHYKPNHLLSFFGKGRVSLPVTEQLAAELLTLPLHPGLTEDDVHRACDAVLEGLEA